MARFGAARIAEWEDRFHFDDRVWESKGLGGGDMQRVEGLDGVEAYRGNTGPGDGWGSPNGLDILEIERIPITFSAINTLEAQILARDPKFNLFPKDANATDAAETARVSEAVVNHFVGELKMRREWRRSFHHAVQVKGGFGCCRHGYTPSIRKIDDNGKLIEFFDPAKPDLPWLRAYAPWDVRIDPTARSFHPDDDARYVRFRDVLHEDAAQRDPEIKAIRGGIQPTVKRRIRGEPSRLDGGPDLVKMIEVWTCFDKVEGTFFRWSPGAPGKVVTDPKPWPEGISTDGLPYSFLAFNEQVDDPFPISYVEMILPLNEELNKLRTMMAELAKRMKFLVAMSERIHEEDAESLLEDTGLKDYIRVRGGDARNAVTEVRLGQMPQELFILENRIRDDIREALGQSRFARAQRENVESATEANRIGLGDDVLTARNVGSMATFLEDSIRKWLHGLRSIPGADEFIIPIVGEDDARALIRSEGQRFLRATREQINADSVVRVVQGSFLPPTDDAEKRDALALMQALAPFAEVVNLNQLLVDVLKPFNKNPAKYLLSGPEQDATGATQPNLEPARREVPPAFQAFPGGRTS